jgi:lipopolysaccharide transport system ATP-binding protein
MPSDHPAIRVSHLGKKYSIGGPQEKYLTFRDAIVNSVKAPFRRFSSHSPQPEEFWALKDVSFDVEQGEVVGIIGRNGAGKSTLLKILSRITSPSEGTVDLYGRVGSLLEVGTGFHPELTGRENIFLSGSILGMKRREIDAKLDDIVKFSEIEKFLDTPVKRYSSGMYVRLAFAVAAHMDTEILLVDEVLAVGDAAFQKKCLGKMGDVAAKEGRTVLFVSHNMAAVQQLCIRGILLDQGKIAFLGDITSAIHQYIQGIKQLQKNNLADRKDRKGSQWLKFYKVGFFNNFGVGINQVLSGQDIIVKMYYTSNKVLNNVNVLVSFNVRSATGYLLTNLNSVDCGMPLLSIYSDGYFACKWPHFNLKSGTYDCNLFCSINGEIVDWMQSAFTIDVEDGDFYGSGKIIGREQGDILISCGWTSHKVD